MEAIQYFRLLRRNTWRLILSVTLAVGLALFAFATASPQFESTLAFYVSSRALSTDPSLVYQAELLSQARARSYQQLVTSPSLAEQLVDRLDLGVEPAEIQESLEATLELNDVVLNVTVNGKTQVGTESLATALEKLLPAYVISLQSVPGQTELTTLEVFVPATPPRQTSPDLKRFLALGILGGLMLGLAISWVAEKTSRRIRDVGDVRAIAGTDAMVVDWRRSRWSRKSARGRWDPLLGQLTVAATTARTVALTPISISMPATAHVFDLAKTFALREEDVLLVDADLRDGRMSNFAELGEKRGVADLLADETTVDATLFTASQTSLRLLPAGAPPARALLHIEAVAFENILKEAQQRFNSVLVATPPLLAHSDAAITVGIAGQAILFVPRRKATKSSLASAVSVLRAVDANLVGVILFSGTPANG